MTVSPLVRVELLGGLGNQLFQAAAGFALARRLGGRLEFDLARFRDGGARAYALDGLAHGAGLVRASRSMLARLARHATAGRWRRPSGFAGAIFREKDFAYDPRIEAIAGPCYLSGYFQSARYFAAEAAAIRAAFDPALAASAAARAYAEALPAHALGVHIRLGDFKAEARFTAIHGTLARDYYRRAIALACAARRIERVFVFSDQPEAVAEFLPDGLEATRVTGFSARDDLFLMSRMAHHVIANSTFSWWSAWFDARPEALVIAPRAWFAPDFLKKTYTGDLFPDGWITL